MQLETARERLEFWPILTDQFHDNNEKKKNLSDSKYRGSTRFDRTASVVTSTLIARIAIQITRRYYE